MAASPQKHPEKSDQAAKEAHHLNTITPTFMSLNELARPSLDKVLQGWPEMWREIS